MGGNTGITSDSVYKTALLLTNVNLLDDVLEESVCSIAPVLLAPVTVMNPFKAKLFLSLQTVHQCLVTLCYVYACVSASLCFTYCPCVGTSISHYFHMNRLCTTV